MLTQATKKYSSGVGLPSHSGVTLHQPRKGPSTAWSLWAHSFQTLFLGPLPLGNLRVPSCLLRNAEEAGGSGAAHYSAG